MSQEVDSCYLWISIDSIFLSRTTSNNARFLEIIAFFQWRGDKIEFLFTNYSRNYKNIRSTKTKKNEFFSNFTSYDFISRVQSISSTCYTLFNQETIVRVLNRQIIQNFSNVDETFHVSVKNNISCINFAQTVISSLFLNYNVLGDLLRARKRK